MKLSLNVGDQVPQTGLEKVVARARAAEKELRELAARAGELTGAVIRRGLLRIIDGGGLIVEGTKVDYAAQRVLGDVFAQFRWGAMPDDPKFNRPDGSLQQAWLAYRDDGTLAMAIAELRADDGQYAQAVLWFDRAGHIIFSEDTNSGVGIARPHLPWPSPTPTNTAQWLTHSPAAGDTSWTSIARCEVESQNATMWWNVRTLVDPGVTAEYRWCFQLDAGVQAPVSRAHSNTAGGSYNFGYWRETGVTLPAGVAWGVKVTLDLQVRMTGGADGVHVAKASVVALGGDQS